MTIHYEEFDVSDLVNVDSTGIGEAVEDYVHDWVEENGLNPDEVDYTWSCRVVVKILGKRKARR